LKFGFYYDLKKIDILLIGDLKLFTA